MFEGNLLSQINVESPLPTFIETAIVGNLNRSLQKAFQFAHVLLAEKVDAAAVLLPWCDEIYFSLLALLENTLLVHADTTFTEFIFGLRRSSLTGPTSLGPPFPKYRTLHGPEAQRRLWKWLRWWAFGPPPMTSPEERAIQLINNGGIISSTPVLDGSSATEAAVSPLLLENATTGPNLLGAQSTPVAATLSPLISEQNTETHGSDTLAQLNSSELLSANRASYGHLRFEPLSRKKKLISLLLLTLKPYCEKKLSEWYAQETDMSTDAVALRNAYAYRYPRRASFRAFLVKYVYTFYHVTRETSSLIFNLLYLVEMTPYASPLHCLFGIVLRRETTRDALTASTPRTQRAMLVARVILMLIFVGFNLLEITRNGAGAFIFGSGSSAVEGELPIPPAPIWGRDVLPSRQNGHLLESDAHNEEEYVTPVPGHCPICKKSVTNVSVCTTSGIVGCYPCLYDYVRQHHTCPLTSKPTTVEQIRRVFEC